MFNSQQLTDIKRRLEGRETFKSIADRYGMSQQTMKDKLAACGYRYGSTVLPIQTVPIEEPCASGAK